jgi:hypothetical protein
VTETKLQSPSVNWFNVLAATQLERMQTTNSSCDNGVIADCQLPISHWHFFNLEISNFNVEIQL